MEKETQEKLTDFFSGISVIVNLVLFIWAVTIFGENPRLAWFIFAVACASEMSDGLARIKRAVENLKQ